MKQPKETAALLAESHRKHDPQTTTIKYFPGGPSVRLLEVSTAAPTTYEVLPFEFPSDVANDIHHSSVVILLSPVEFQSLQDGSLTLPQDWDLATAEDL